MTENKTFKETWNELREVHKTPYIKPNMTELEITDSWFEIYDEGQSVKLTDGNRDHEIIKAAFIKLNDRLNKLEQALAVAEDVIKNTEKALDSIKYELNASVYTLTDDEFETTFSCRDNLFLALKKIMAIKEGKICKE